MGRRRRWLAGRHHSKRGWVMVIGRNESYGPVEVSLNWQEYDRPRLAIGDGTRVSYATLMPGSWPEPFGLVAIESLACGTPILARPAGALPEIVRDGVDGFFAADVEGLAAAVDRVGGLDRAAIRASVVDRFSSARMADGYEAIYAGLISPAGEPSAQRVAAATNGDRATG